jgi:acyl transferase domain-containing protein
MNNGKAQVPSSEQVLLALQKARTKLEAAERAATEPIAIVGMGCRFPGGASDPDSFWRVLRDGVDAVTRIPRDRWDADAYYDPRPGVPGKMITRDAALLAGVDGFDPQFFGISPREAVSLDPQHRLLLEVSWEALEHAGLAGDRLGASRTGVFVGIGQSDYARLQARDCMLVFTCGRTSRVPEPAYE